MVARNARTLVPDGRIRNDRLACSAIFSGSLLWFRSRFSLFSLSFAQQEFLPHSAPANASVSNVGKVQAHDNANFSIAPACDGLLFPFAENAGMVYTEDGYKSLLGLVMAATQGRGQQLWALHYGWMWPAAFGSDVAEVDPYFLKWMIGVDRAAAADAVVLWGLPNEAGRIADHGGIFAERQPPDHVVTA